MQIRSQQLAVRVKVFIIAITGNKSKMVTKGPDLQGSVLMANRPGVLAVRNMDSQQEYH